MRIRNPRVYLGYACLFVAALIVRFTYWSEIRGTPLDRWHTWTETDSATYLEQAHRMAAGDWLGRDPYHPYHLWQRASGSPQDWLSWYGPAAFHQAPYYSVFLALTEKLLNRFIDVVKLVQIVLGAGTCVIVALIARRLGGTVVGFVAGALCVIYGPLYYLETQVLREGPAILGEALLILMVVHCVLLPPNATRRRRLLVRGLSGALAGFLVCFHESAMPLAVAALLILALHGAWISWRRAAAAVMTFAVGYLIGFAPMLARNVTVGAAPFSTSSRLAVNLAYCNMSSAADGGVIFRPPGPQLKQIMNRAHGSIFGVVREVWRGYKGNRLAFFANLRQRFTAIWMTVEFPDNTSYTFYCSQAPILNASLSFACIAAPAVAAILGLLLAAKFVRRHPVNSIGSARRKHQIAVPPSPDRPFQQIWRAGSAAVHLAVLGFLPPLVAAMTLVHPQARYRLFLVPIMLCYAAIGIVAAWRWTRARRFPAMFAFAGLGLSLFAVQRMISANWLGADDRYTDWAFTAQSYMHDEKYDAAIPYVRHALTIDPAQASVRESLAYALIKANRYDEAREELIAVLRRRPNSDRARHWLEFVEQQIQARNAAPPRGTPTP